MARCDNKDHERFHGVFDAHNGCLACQCALEAQLKTEARAEVQRLREALSYYASEYDWSYWETNVVNDPDGWIFGAADKDEPPYQIAKDAIEEKTS